MTLISGCAVPSDTAHPHRISIPTTTSTLKTHNIDNITTFCHCETPPHLNKYPHQKFLCVD